MESLKRGANPDDRFHVFYCHDPGCLADFAEAGISAIHLDAPPPSPVTAGFPVQYNGKTVYFKIRPYSQELQRQTERHNIDLMLYTNIERESFESSIPYLTVLLDWTHKTHPQFAEFTADGVYEQREYIITNSVRDAVCVIADSKTAKEEIVSFYNLSPEKIKVLPFVPPPYFYDPPQPGLQDMVKKEFSLPERFIFYPAQFWPHKNHLNIVRAIASIKRNNNLVIPAVFTGSTGNRWSSYNAVMDLAADLAVQEQIACLGYVTTSQIKALYRLTAALVMPTFPGPTNIPVLEAFASDCPVITSDINALREQVGNASLLVDPDSHQDIANAILKLWQDKALVRKLILRGRKKLASWGPQEFASSLRQIIEISKQSITDSSVDTAYYNTTKC